MQTTSAALRLVKSVETSMKIPTTSGAFDVRRLLLNLRTSANTVRLDTCSEYGCLDLVEFPHDRGSRTCHQHTCRTPGCRQRAPDNQRLCVNHQCRDPDCENAKWNIRPYCRSHSCQDVGCDQKSLVPGGYCISRACEQDGCVEARGDRQYPELCDTHGRERMVHVAEDRGRGQVVGREQLLRRGQPRQHGYGYGRVVPDPANDAYYERLNQRWAEHQGRR